MAWNRVVPGRRLTRIIAARSPRPRERIYLCNWFVKLVKPGKELPADQVQCHVPMKYVVEAPN